MNTSCRYSLGIYLLKHNLIIGCLNFEYNGYVYETSVSFKFEKVEIVPLHFWKEVLCHQVSLDIVGAELVTVNFLCLRDDPEGDRAILEKLPKKCGIVLVVKVKESADAISSFLREKFKAEISCV